MILEAEHLSKTYHQGTAPIEVLTDLQLQVAEGETLAILGQSGSGKSTLLSLLAGLDHPTSGTVRVAGTDLGKLSEDALTEFRARHIGIIFQHFHLISTLTALENVALPLEIQRKGNAESTAAQWLERVGLAPRQHHFPRQLSGGEQQRVAIARALAAQPKVLLGDEPSGSLDSATGTQIMELLFDLADREKRTLILVTHNSELAARCDRTLLLKGGRFS